MKPTKRFALIILTIVMLATCTAPVFADTIIDYVLYTDIYTYFEGMIIDSYNINGYTAVIVENLSYYCFDVTWNEQARTLNVKFNPAKEITGLPYPLVAADKSRVGERLQPVYATDIKTYLDGQEIKSYNIGGETIIYVDDLAEKYAKNYKYNGTSRSLWVDFIASDPNGVPTSPVVAPAAAPAAASASAPVPAIYYKSKTSSVNQKIDKSSIKSNVGHYSYEDKDEGEKNIFDGDPETKWCTNYKEFGDGKNEIIVEWAMKEPVRVERYVITTANDTESYPGRNPRTWTLEAKKKKNGKWKVISAEKDIALPQEDFADSLFFKVDDPDEYTYYRLVITDNLEHIDIYQFSELKLFTYKEIPMYTYYDPNTFDQLSDYLKKYGFGDDSRLIDVFPFVDGVEVVIDYTDTSNSYIISVILENDTEKLAISVVLIEYDEEVAVGAEFSHWSNDELDDFVDSAIIPGTFRGYEYYDEDKCDPGLEVWIDGYLGSGYFEALASYYDTELQPFVELMTTWGEYTNYVLDLICPGATIADFGFVKFGK